MIARHSSWINQLKIADVVDKLSSMLLIIFILLKEWMQNLLSSEGKLFTKQLIFICFLANVCGLFSVVGEAECMWDICILYTRSIDPRSFLAVLFASYSVSSPFHLRALSYSTFTEPCDWLSCFYVANYVLNNFVTCTAFMLNIVTRLNDGRVRWEIK